jgi:hypothetical protein
METDMMLALLHQLVSADAKNAPEFISPADILAEELEGSERYADPELRRLQVQAWAGSSEGEVIESAGPGSGVR